jgi:hypothetical protein
MRADNSEYWGLFENRPAKERTSTSARGQAARQSGAKGTDRGPRTSRTPRTYAKRERAKC